MLISQSRRDGIVAAMRPHFATCAIKVNGNPNYRFIAGEVVFAKDVDTLIVHVGPTPEADQLVVQWVQTHPHKDDFTEDFVKTVYWPEKTSKK